MRRIQLRLYIALLQVPDLYLTRRMRPMTNRGEREREREVLKKCLASLLWACVKVRRPFLVQGGGHGNWITRRR